MQGECPTETKCAIVDPQGAFNPYKTNVDENKSPFLGCKHIPLEDERSTETIFYKGFSQ